MLDPVRVPITNCTILQWRAAKTSSAMGTERKALGLSFYCRGRT